MAEVFIGSEAMAAGRVTRHELSRWYMAIHRGVYTPKNAELSLRDRAIAAWLASRRHGVIAGVAASALHGAPWVDPAHPIELAASEDPSTEGFGTPDRAHRVRRDHSHRRLTCHHPGPHRIRPRPSPRPAVGVGPAGRADVEPSLLHRRREGAGEALSACPGRKAITRIASSHRRWCGISEGISHSTVVDGRRLPATGDADTRAQRFLPGGIPGYGLA